MSFQGMDTGQVRDLQALFVQHRSTLEERASTLASTVSSVLESGWQGPDAESFGGRFDSEVRSRAQALLDTFQGFADDLLDQVDDQDRTSEDDGGSGGAPGGAMPFTPGSPGGGAPAPAAPSSDDSFWGPDWSIGEAGKKIFENIFMPWKSPGAGSVITARGIIHALGQLGGETMPHFFGPLGDVYTGIAGGVDRWVQDGKEHPGMSVGTRLGRAFFDGGMNLVGSWAGRVGGTALGTALGGGATIETGPGALAGGALGGLIGGTVGSYVGNGVMNGLADSLLD